MASPFWRAGFWRRLFRRAEPESQPRPKTYIYVSDAKVDMLTAGLSKPLRDQFDLKVQGGVPGVVSVEIGARQNETSRYERAERLCKALATIEGLVGDVNDENADYIRGTLVATWGFYGRVNDGYADVIFFTSFADENTLVGLGGSAYHTMERSEDRLQKWSNSGIRQLMSFLKEQSEAGNGERHLTTLTDAWGAETGDADHDNIVIPEEIEFVAQRLSHQSYGGYRFILGSPIYVARTGRPLTNQALKVYTGVRDAYSLARHERHLYTKDTNGVWQLGRPSFPALPPLVDPDRKASGDGRATDAKPPESGALPELRSAD